MYAGGWFEKIDGDETRHVELLEEMASLFVQGSWLHKASVQHTYAPASELCQNCYNAKSCNITSRAVQAMVAWNC